jgi:predicted dehydrogenase
MHCSKRRPRVAMIYSITSSARASNVGGGVTGAQLSRRAHECPVEDYASVMLRPTSGILGTVEVGNGFPRDGTDGEWKIAGRDAILTMKDGIVKLATAEGDETLPGSDITAPAAPNCSEVPRQDLPSPPFRGVAKVM